MPTRILHLRLSDPVLISMDQLAARLQALTGLRAAKLTRDVQFRVAVIAAENTPDDELLRYLPAELLDDLPDRELNP